MKVKLAAHTARVMIDSGATGNYISQKTVTRLQIHTVARDAPYTVRQIDGSLVGGQGEVTR